MNYQPIVVTYLGLLVSLNTAAQSNTASDTARHAVSGRPYRQLYATGFVGVTNPSGDAARYSKFGLRTSTGFEYQIRPGIWLASSLLFDLYFFNQTNNGVSIQGQSSAIQLNVLTAYTPLTRANYQPYVVGGIGLAFLSGPYAEANYDIRQVTVTMPGALLVAIQAGIGVQHTLFRKYKGFAEASYQVIPAVKCAGITDLQQFSIHVGIKTPVNL